MMKRKISLIILITLILALSWETVAFAQSDGTLPISGILNSGETDLVHPASLMTDEDPDTNWQLNPGSTGGWAELDLSEAALIYGLQLAGRLAGGTRLFVEYRQKGQWVPFVATPLSELPEKGLIDLSYDRVMTDGIRIRLIGSSAGDCRFTEIKILGRSLQGLSSRIIPIQINADRESMTAPAAFLADGNTYTQWMTPPLSLQGEVIFKFSRTSQIDSISLFFTRQMTGKFHLYAWNAGQWQDLGLLRPQNPGWLRFDLSSQPVNTDQIKLKVTNGFGTLGGVSEVEFWGLGDALGDQRQLIGAVTPQSLSTDLNTCFTTDSPGNRRLEIICHDGSGVPLLVDLNDQSFTLLPILTLRDQIIYSVPINKSDLWKGQNYLRIHSAKSSGTIEGIWLVEPAGAGECDLPNGPLSDGLLLTGEVSNTSVILPLNQSASVESVEVYSTAGATLSVSALFNGVWVDLALVSDEAGRLVFSGPMTTNQIRVNNLGGFILREIRVMGSMTTDHAPIVRILEPEGNIVANSYKTSDIMIRGFVDNLDAKVTINGESVPLTGHYFAYRVKIFGRKFWDTQTFTVLATDAQNRQSQDSIDLLIADPNYIKINQENSKYYTDKNSFTVSGTNQCPFSKVYIDDEMVLNGHGNFSKECPLQEGLNLIQIKVVITQPNEQPFTLIRIVQVIRYGRQMVLTIDAPLSNAIVNTPVIQVYGTVQGLGAVQVRVNNAPATVNGFFYTSTVTLQDGENQVTVMASDSRGDTVQQKTIVTLNRNGPVIRQVTPADGSIVNHGSVEVMAKVDGSGPVWVTINNQLVQAGPDGFYHAILSMEDGIHSIAIHLQDQAGNSTTYTERVTVDTQAPDSFAVSADSSGWSNNAQPIITFHTTDATTGVDHYELAVDDGAFRTVMSPYRLPGLSDGEHIITVKAVDKAGWTTISCVKVYIDTTAPGLPPNFRQIPGNGRIILKWDAPSDDTVRYRIERQASPEGLPGRVIVLQGATEYTDDGLTNGEIYQYRIEAIDRANNVGPISEWKAAESGLTVADYRTERGTVVEYDHVIMVIKPQSLPDTVKSIQVTEIQSDDMKSRAMYPIISPIYQFSMTTTDNSKTINIEHMVFKDEYIASISYDPSLVPKGFPEQNLGVYYFDPMWDRWFKVRESDVDIEHHTIYFVTNHFSSFTVQPTILEDLSPQELSDVGYSPFKTKTTHGGVTVSPEGGSSMVSVTELNLPGKNGFDFILKRTYDLTTARGDSPGLTANAELGISMRSVNGDLKTIHQIADEILHSGSSITAQVDASVLQGIEQKIKNIFQNCGDYAYTMGLGWRLNIPYIRGSNSSILLRLPDGSFYSMNSLNLTDDKDTLGVKRVLKFENHTGADFTLYVTQVRGNVNVFDITSITKTVPGWQITEAKLVMKDGTTYDFDGLGRTTKITDPTGLNSIVFNYNGLLLDYVLDSVGRKIHFDYETETFLLPKIKRIWIENDTREIKYTISGSVESSNQVFPLLMKAKDVGGREWKYTYGHNFLFSDGIGVKVNILQCILDYYTAGSASYLLGMDDVTLKGNAQCEWVFPLATVEGPGIGYTKISYEQKALSYVRWSSQDYFLGIVPVSKEIDYQIEQRLLTKKVEVFKNSKEESPILTTEYTYDLHYYGHCQFLNHKTTMDDGRKTTVFSYKATSNIFVILIGRT